MKLYKKKKKRGHGFGNFNPFLSSEGLTSSMSKEQAEQPAGGACMDISTPCAEELCQRWETDRGCFATASTQIAATRFTLCLLCAFIDELSLTLARSLPSTNFYWTSGEVTTHQWHRMHQQTPQWEILGAGGASKPNKPPVPLTSL